MIRRALALLPLLAAAASPNLPACTGPLCGFQSPEDLSLLPDTPYIVVSQQPPAAPLVLVHLRPPHARIPVPLTAGAAPTLGPPDCPGVPTTTVQPRGHSVGRLDGQSVLALINAGPPYRIELFRITNSPDTAIPTLHWAGCIPVPENRPLNDLALDSRGTLYATHMFTPPAPGQPADTLRAEFLAARPTGQVLRWTRDTGWSAMADTDLSFANGIALSADGRTLAAAGTFDQAVLLIDLATNSRRKVPLPLQPDNINVAADGRFIVAGHTGAPVTGVAPCQPAAARPCGFPFAVAAFTPGGQVTVLYRHDGSIHPGASVALLHDHALIIGSAYGDRLVRLPEIASVSASSPHALAPSFGADSDPSDPPSSR